MTRRIDWIVIHCSATDPDWHGKVTRDTIHDWHLQRGWRGIGYHFVVERDGTLAMGRPISEAGAHLRGANSRSIGICLVGGVKVEGGEHVPTDNFTDAQWITLTAITSALTEAFPEADVIGHRDYPGVTKACPSFDAIQWWSDAQPR